MITICKECDKTFSILPSRVNINGNYCSRQCMHKSFRARPERRNGIVKQCEVCSSMFYVTQSRSYYKFCSYRCRGLSCSMNTRGSKHWRWRPSPDRFWEKVSFSCELDGCWIWLGKCDKHGYGKFSESSKYILAHQWSYRRAFGDIPEGLILRHTCHNPKCVRPSHLLVGTHFQNSQDMVAAYRHRYGELCSKAKITEVDVRAILLLGREDKVYPKAIADNYGISVRQVSRLLRGTSWRHITDRGE
jgi:hypothetical protein